MKTTLILTALASYAFASPITLLDRGDTTSTYAGYSADTLAKCEAAPNCEITQGPFGPRIGFISGEEPGTHKYEKRFAYLKKRQENNGTVPTPPPPPPAEPKATTNREMSPNMINYGASLPQDVVNRLYDFCYTSTCTTEPQTWNTKIAGPWNNDDTTLMIEAHGNYENVEARNFYIEALRGMVYVGTQTQTGKWGNGGTCLECLGGSGEQDEFHQSNFASVNRFLDGNLRGYMSVYIRNKDEGGLCERVTEALATIASFAGPAAFFFGETKNLCGKGN